MDVRLWDLFCGQGSECDPLRKQSGDLDGSECENALRQRGRDALLSQDGRKPEVLV